LEPLGLLLISGLVVVVDWFLLVAIPFALLVVFLPSRRILAMGLAALALAASMAGPADSGLWFVERGWALLVGGAFVALTIRWPHKPFLPRGLGAVGAGFLGAGLIFRVRPGDWAVVDWAVRSRIGSFWSFFLNLVREGLRPETLPPEFEATALARAADQAYLYPGLLGLASLSALALAWWIFVALARSGEQALRPVREFRFNDQLVWVLIGGVGLLLASSGTLERLGTNAVVFLGGLYALRGAAVMLFLSGGVSLFGGIALFLGFFFLAPLIVAGAFVLGLGDTWLDLRARREGSPAG
jgi:hypothetical protein